MIDQKQILIIENQLGREPRGLEAIVRQTPAGVPLVLQIRSWVDDQPFPTLYWLSSKDLSRAIARLETDGWVGRLEQELSEDPGLMAAYQQNHADYVQRRWQLMRPEDRDRIEAKGFTELFNRYGIGGIAQWDKVRCLHMHYADFLAGDDGRSQNIIGARLEQDFQLSQLAIQI